MASDRSAMVHARLSISYYKKESRVLHALDHGPDMLAEARPKLPDKAVKSGDIKPKNKQLKHLHIQFDLALVNHQKYP